ncbi:MAG: carboxypeptidase-like regulatory domain-containing protein [Bacteroidia bacterium]
MNSQKPYQQILVFVLLLYAGMSLSGQTTIAGYVTEDSTAEPLSFVSIRVAGTAQGANTNQYGYFVLKIPKSVSFPVRLEFQFIGYQKKSLTLNQAPDEPLQVRMKTGSVELDSVEITAASLPKGKTPSRFVFDQKLLKSIPTVLGEVDVIRALKILPGVSRANEGNSGLFVRGGSGDQNLILLDEAPVYNVNHLFGFFSVFNGEAIQSVEFIKGAFPANYGGRLSSVLSVTTKTGNAKKWGAQGSVGMTSSRIAVSGPILKKKGTLLLSARRTYWDAVVAPFLLTSDANGKIVPFFFFHDYNAKLTYDLGKKDKLYLSAYTSRDKYGQKDIGTNTRNDNGITWRNYTASLRWNRRIKPDLFVNTSLIFTNYRVRLFNYFESRQGNEGFAEQESGSAIRDYSIKTDWLWSASPSHTIKFGAQAFLHRFNPNILTEASGGNAGFQGIDGNFTIRNKFQGLETAAYASDEIQLGERLTVTAGMRFASYFAEDIQENRFEPRLLAEFRVAKNNYLSASYTQMNQFIHQVSNNGAALPIDVWLPSTATIAPQGSWQSTLGYTIEFPESGLDIQIEGYYKNIENAVRFLEGTTLLNLDFVNLDIRELRWQELVTQGDGNSYGLELFVKKKAERWSLIGSYTLSKTEYQFDELNNGNAFAPAFDRRHQLNAVFNYQLNEKIEFNAACYVATGNPAPVPEAIVELTGHLGNGFRPYSAFAGLDGFRSEWYHRLDASVKFKKKKKWGSRYWEFGAYNIYNKLNPTFFDIIEVANEVAGTATAQLRKNAFFFITPSISYNFSF